MKGGACFLDRLGSSLPKEKTWFPFESPDCLFVFGSYPKTKWQAYPSMEGEIGAHT